MKVRIFAAGSSFLLGLLLGAAAMVPITGRHVEQLTLEQLRLLQETAQYQSRLRKLEAALQNPQQAVIGDVTLQILWPDEATRLDLTEKLAPIAHELVGRQVTDINPYLIFAVFDDRVIDLSHRRYRVNVRAVVISAETLIILTVTEEVMDTTSTAYTLSRADR